MTTWVNSNSITMMHLQLRQLGIAFAMSLVSSSATYAESPPPPEPAHSAASAPHWGYEGDIRPEKWSELSPEYAGCKIGKNQSPVDIEHTYSTSLEPLDIHYSIAPQDMVNNGHTIQVTPANDSGYLQLANDRYALKQFHFHSPSENLIKGKSFPLEGHFVHSDKDGNLLVMAVMFEAGAQNKQIDLLLDSLAAVGASKHLNEPVEVDALLPKQHGYYRFAGSLTTPPCSEGVTWIVLKTPVTVSETQIKRFESVLHHNNRPVQPLNGRLVVD